MFDLNDFDETLPGPFEYDVKRMAASFTVAGRNNGFSAADTRAATLASVAAYRQAMAAFAQMRTMDIWYAHLDEDQLMAAVRTTVAATAKGVATHSTCRSPTSHSVTPTRTSETLSSSCRRSGPGGWKPPRACEGRQTTTGCTALWTPGDQPRPRRPRSRSVKPSCQEASRSRRVRAPGSVPSWRRTPPR